jgi:hypothetical protein
MATTYFGKSVNGVPFDSDGNVVMGGGAIRFGIEDNLGVQDRAIDLGNNDLDISNYKYLNLGDEFSVNDLYGRNYTERSYLFLRKIDGNFVPQFMTFAAKQSGITDQTGIKTSKTDGVLNVDGNKLHAQLQSDIVGDDSEGNNFGSSFNNSSLLDSVLNLVSDASHQLFSFINSTKSNFIGAVVKNKATAEISCYVENTDGSKGGKAKIDFISETDGTNIIGNRLTLHAIRNEDGGYSEIAISTDNPIPQIDFTIINAGGTTLKITTPEPSGVDVTTYLPLSVNGNFADSAGNIPLRLQSYTVATLPASPTQGDMAAVTDATSPTYLGALTGGGSVYTPCIFNGTIWISH